MTRDPSSAPRRLAFFKALGPAVIVASVVLGPGSILTSSKVGAAYGLGMVWVLLLASGLMMGMVALGARLGVVLEGTLSDELAARAGRPLAAAAGLVIFLICASFQFGNNLGVVAAIEPWLEERSGASPAVSWLPDAILAGLNGIAIAFLFGLRRLYKPIERLMMLLVGIMLLAFLGNLAYLAATGGGGASVTTAAARPAAASSGAPLAALGLIGTTFSVAGAFYQSYLVREKGWGMRELRQGLVDSVAGISVLSAVSLGIMISAAISFHGRPVELATLADVARQLEPLFGRAALVLFSLGVFAAAFSSFLVNAMIGGAMLSDGIGLGGRMDSLPTKVFTTAVLLAGMAVATFVPAEDRVGLIVTAQAMTVIGLPLLAASMLYLATRAELRGVRAVPVWMKAVAALGLLVVLASAGRLAWTLAAKVIG